MTVCVHPQDSAQVLDEGLSRLLDRAPSSLSAIADLLKWSEDEGGGQSHLLQVKVTCSAERPIQSRGSFQNRPGCCWLLFNPLSFSDSVLRAGRPQH